MDEHRPAALSPASSALVERGDLDELTSYVNRLVADQAWPELDALRGACRAALERGKQLWAVAAHIEYRLCLEAPSSWAALMLETGTGRFAFGPLPEVAASTHAWAELSAHLHCTPSAAMAAHERVLRGDDLSNDPLAATLPEVLELPLRLQPWEPRYVVAEYHQDRMEFPPPPLVGTSPAPLLSAPPRLGSARDGAGPEHGLGQAKVDEVSVALEDLVTAWTAESNGRAEAVAVEGQALDAISALGAHVRHLVPVSPATAMAAMAWAAADGGAHGRRRGAAPGRFGAWWVLAAIAGLTDQSPLPAARLGQALDGMSWYAWDSGEPVTGWSLRLALEAHNGPRQGFAWALSATDAA